MRKEKKIRIENRQRVKKKLIDKHYNEEDQGAGAVKLTGLDFIQQLNIV